MDDRVVLEKLWIYELFQPKLIRAFSGQHKSNVFFLYTSGCLNLTKTEYDEIEQERKRLNGESKLTYEETLLCEVGEQVYLISARGSSSRKPRRVRNIVFRCLGNQIHVYARILLVAIM